MRIKAACLVSSKLTLAARVDSSHESRSGEEGLKFRAIIDKKMDKWQEPAPVKNIKALPAPLDQARKKRGGRRARKTKEKLGATDMRKAANRTTFAEVLKTNTDS